MSLKLPSAYLLVTHGSRDPRPQAAVEELARLLIENIKLLESSLPKNAQRLAKKLDALGVQPDSFDLTTSTISSSESSFLPQELRVGTACLECHPLALHVQIQQFCDRILASLPVNHPSTVKPLHLQILPLFLLPGVHVKEDIPAEVAIARKHLDTRLSIDLRPHLGSHPNLSSLLTNQRISSSADAWILLSHGSRRTGGNAPVEALAKQLGVVPAYWSVSPDLKSRIQELAHIGHRRVGIIPYFLFAGAITDAIAQVVDQLSQTFPTVDLQLTPPLGASSELAELVFDLTFD